MKLDDMYVAGLGVFLPELVSVKDAVAQGLCDQETAEIGWVSTRVAGDMPAPDLAIRACKQALERSGHAHEDIHVLLHACVSHQGPDGWSPPHYIQHNTIGGRAPAFGMRHGCNGMFDAMELAVAYLAAAPERTAALVTAADNFGTPMFDRWRSTRAVVFSDIGSAMVLSKRPGFARMCSIASVSLPEMEKMGRGNEAIFPPGVTVGRPLDFEARYDEYDEGIWMDAQRLVVGATESAVAQCLDEAGITLSDVVRVAHQTPGSEEYAKYLLDPIGIDVSKGIVRFGSENGRSGASDQTAGLNHLVETGQVGPGDHVLMLGSGPGMSITCAVVEILERPSWSGAA